ncbi:MAG: hypothetical protein WAM60_10125, partial [Candidatus Promineifilaceae bacterium]
MTTQTAELRPTPPETLAQYLVLLLKGLLKRLPLKLLMAGAVALLAWIVHTYLLVVTNEGFNAGNSVWLDRILALQGRTITGTLVWTLAAGLVTSTIARIFAYGFKNTIRSVVDTPRYIWDWATELGVWAIPLLFVGYFSAVFVCLFIGNGLLIAQMWLVVLGILIARNTSVLLTILRFGWSDAQRLLKREKVKPFQLSWPGMYLMGVLMGLLVSIPNGLFFYVCGCFGFLLLVLASVGLFVRSGGSERLIGKKILFWVLPPAFLLLFLAAAPVFADDGGWAESGGTFSGWISSPGAARAIVMGILPAAGSGLGVLFGTALGSMVSIMGTAGITANPLSFRPSSPTSQSGSSTPPSPARTADHQVEGFQQHQAGTTAPRTAEGRLGKPPDKPPESRTADHQLDQPEQSTSEPSSMPPRHKPGEGAEAARPDTTEGGVGLRSDRASHEAPGQSRTGQEATGAPTGQRDVQGVQPQSGSQGGTGSGSAVESAGHAKGMENDSPAGRMSDRNRPETPERTNGPLSDRHQQGGLAEKGADSGKSVGRERAGGMAEKDTTAGPTAERHDPGGMAEDINAKPAAIEQPGLKAERHTPEVEGGPTAQRHTPGGMAEDINAKPGASEQPGLKAERHTPDVEGGPTAQRHTPGGMKEDINAKPGASEQPGL